ncbi:type II toxin-antitoxin system RelE/ParE family toxin [Sporolactobacillus shoreae]|uniref:Type II toxin-antitoxin system RelE/ParE family toxin n=1 Tax=Sporolactobacillus shoreae TaxID=1465501 RepID=A0A4Z0GPM9_9BACL|nr:type II toxin-antitoxin system RelE/ParE family toxin [Sporolactobacillus shoreae]TGA98319.1 type II toxin-antitoxin system RelE/ParE family toxin [Sporolactobacillus shoreae]
MRPYKLSMTQIAVNDLHEISEYIAKELREPETARSLVIKIKEAVMGLSEMPARYAFVADQYLSSRGIRWLMVDRYIFFYLIDEEEFTVIVVRILYGKRNWKQFL